MAKFSSKSALKIEVPSLTVAIIVIGAFLVGYLLTILSAVHSFVIIVLLLISVCVFLWPEAGLYLVIFSMLLSPEIIAGELVGKANLARGFTLRLEDLLLVSIGLSWFTRSAIDKTTGLFRKTPLSQPIAAYILASFLATLWGKITGDVEGMAGFFFVLKYFEYIIIFFMVVNYVNTEDQVKRLLFCLFLTCFIVTIYGLVQIPSGVRVSAPFEGKSGEPNTLGGYLVFMGAVAVALIDHMKEVRVRLGLAVLMVVLIISLLYTQSRASYLAVIPTYLVITLFGRKKLHLAAGLIIILTLGPLILPRVAEERIAYTFTQPEAKGQIQIGRFRLDTSLSSRVYSWKSGLSAWQKRPILGHGVTGFRFMDAQYPRILVETGVIGMLAFAWLIYAIFRVGLNAWSEQQDDLLRGLSVGLIAGLVGLLVHAIGANTFIIVRIMEPFWFLTGIVVTLSAMGKDSTEVFAS